MQRQLQRACSPGVSHYAERAANGCFDLDMEAHLPID